MIFLGGLIFDEVIVHYVSKLESDNGRSIIRKINQRFIKISWFCIVIIVITGLTMMLTSQWSNRQIYTLASKQLILLLMIIITYGYTKMIKYLNSPSSNGGFDVRAEVYRFRVSQFRKINIFLGLTTLLLSVILRLDV